MLNILSLLIGLGTFVLALFAFIPFLGAANWLLIPIVLVGLLLGVLSRSNTGRNVNLVVLLVCIVRLSIGHGIL